MIIWFGKTAWKRCLLSACHSSNGRVRPWCPSVDLSCQILRADKNLVDEQNPENDPHFAALLPALRPWPNRLNWVWEARRRCTILKTVVKCRRRWSGVGVNCRAVYQSFCFRVASNMRCDQARSALYNLTLTISKPKVTRLALKVGE